MTKYLKLFAQAIGMKKTVKRTRNELAKTKGPVAKGWGRPIYSTSKEPSEDKETPTTESETKPLDIHEYYHVSNSRKQWVKDNPDLKNNNICTTNCLQPEEHMSTYLRGTKDNYGKDL